MRGTWGRDLVMVGALIAAGFVLAWVRFRPFLGDDGFYSDGTSGERLRGWPGIAGPVRRAERS